MSFRFRQIFKIFPGVKVNLSKSGLSLSLGTRGLSANIGKKGVRGTVGIPGTGLSYSAMMPYEKKSSAEPRNDRMEHDSKESRNEAHHPFKLSREQRIEVLRQQLRQETRSDLSKRIHIFANKEMFEENSSCPGEPVVPKMPLEERFHAFEPKGIYILWAIGLVIGFAFPLGLLSLLLGPVLAYPLAWITKHKLGY